MHLILTYSICLHQIQGLHGAGGRGQFQILFFFHENFDKTKGQNGKLKFWMKQAVVKAEKSEIELVGPIYRHLLSPIFAFVSAYNCFLSHFPMREPHVLHNLPTNIAYLPSVSSTRYSTRVSENDGYLLTLPAYYNMAAFCTPHAPHAESVIS